MENSRPNPTRAAGVLILTRNEPREFLMLRHPDRWDLPKGHCEPGETFRETALRELQEETGIDHRLVELDDEFVFELEYPVQYPGQPRPIVKLVRYFLGTVAGKPTLQLTEHSGYEWFRWDPPHRIQSQTIDPLLAAVAAKLKRQ